MDELAIGTALGSYRILELLGEGGMGRVYVAEHLKLGRRVALKMLRQQYAANPIAVARFFAEARAVNRISHDNIVEITDFFENPGGANYFIMELLRGVDLARVLLREGPLPVPRVVEIMRQVASVLGAVHDAKIIHRDLKPDNIFLIERAGCRDFVKLLDFGVAKLTEIQGPYKPKTTAAGSIIGTPEYMSPEQAGGQEVDHRSDIYSLGVIMYEMLSGHSPFKGKSFGEIVIKHMTLDPKPLGEYTNLPEPVPGSVDAFVTSLLAKDRERRPQTMTEVEDTLQGIMDYVAPVVEVRRAESMRIVRRPSSSRSEPKTTPASKVPSGVPAEMNGREPTIDAAASVDMIAPAMRSQRKLLLAGAAVVVVAIAMWIGIRSGGSSRTDATAAVANPTTPATASPSTSPAPPPPVKPQPANPAAVVAEPPPAPKAATPPPPSTALPTKKSPAPKRAAIKPPTPTKPRNDRVDRNGTMDVFGGS